MKSFATLLILGSVIASPALAGGSVEKGKMLFDNGGTRLGVVYKVTADGSAQIIFEGKLVTVPGTTISDAAGRLETNLSKSQLT